MQKCIFDYFDQNLVSCRVETPPTASTCCVHVGSKSKKLSTHHGHSKYLYNIHAREVSPYPLAFHSFTMSGFRVSFDENGRRQIHPPANAIRIGGPGSNCFSTVRMRLGMPDKLPPYPVFASENQALHYDPQQSMLELEPSPVCGVCKASTTSAGKPLLKCSRCKLVHYCCKDHQAEDYKKRHKSNCRFFDELEKRIAPLVQEGVQEDPERDIDKFREFHHYREAKWQLLYEMGLKYRSKSILTQLCSEYNALFSRLNDLDYINATALKAQFAFLLLILGRDEKAMHFCLYWIQVGEWYGNDDEKWRNFKETNCRQVHQAAEESSNTKDWIYGSGADLEGPMFLDFMEGMDWDLHQEFEPLLCLAMYIAKIRLLQKRCALICRAEFFSDGSKLPGDIKDKIISYVDTNQDIVGVTAKTDIPRLLKKIHRHHATLLPALINPEPFNEWRKRGGEDKLYGENAEVHIALEFGAKALLTKTVWGLGYIQRIFGKKPNYVVND